MNDLLTEDHRELDQLLQNLYTALENGTPLELFEKLDIFWARLAMHIRAEHLQLFPITLKALESADRKMAARGRAAFKQLRVEHDFFMVELAAAMKLVRSLIRDEADSPQVRQAVRKKITEVHELLLTHNELEESEVYVWSRDLLTPVELTNLENEMKRELDNLPPRFDGDRVGNAPRNYE